MLDGENVVGEVPPTIQSQLEEAPGIGGVLETNTAAWNSNTTREGKPVEVSVVEPCGNGSKEKDRQKPLHQRVRRIFVYDLDGLNAVVRWGKGLQRGQPSFVVAADRRLAAHFRSQRTISSCWGCCVSRLM